MQKAIHQQNTQGTSPLQKFADAALDLTRRFMPAPYLFALILTFLSAFLALAITKSGLAQITDAWYRGFWDILVFTAQMALMLMGGHALADAPFVKRGLDWLSGCAKNEAHAALLLFFIGWTTALFN
jgi:short-chain fatty acids transporter